MLDFNPRPREEGDHQQEAGDAPRGDFNPRPREEGDVLTEFCAVEVVISIHALVKRAT